MIQVIQDPNRQTFGESAANTLSAVLQGLASAKAQEIQQRKQYNTNVAGLKALNVENAEQLAHLPPNLLEMVTKQKLEEPSQLAFANALQTILGGETSAVPQQQQQLPPPKKSPYPFVSPQKREQLENYLKTPKAQAKYSSEDIAKIQGILRSPEIMQPTVPVAEGKPARSAFAGLNQKQALELAKLGIDVRKNVQREKTEAFKLTKDERKQILDTSRQARQNLHDLERMEDLEKEGKLDTPGYVEFLKRSGLDIPALTNPGSEEFAKIAQTFLRDAKTYLGARISNFELEQFLKTVPSLSQSPEGRKRVIANLKRFNRISLEYGDALKQVVQENHGVPPLDLMEQVDDRVEKKMDHYAELFKKDLSKPVPKGQNKLITALQAATGEAIGQAGGIASAGAGAYAGYRIGSPFGPWAAALGAGVGAFLPSLMKHLPSL